jgi:hypothetical protein
VIEDHVNSHEETSKEFKALQQEKGQLRAVNTAGMKLPQLVGKQVAAGTGESIVAIPQGLRTRRFEVRKPVTSQQTKKSVGTRIKVIFVPLLTNMLLP